MAEKRIYEISNPSDPVTLETDNELVAAVAVLLLGEGKMGLHRDDGETVLPIFLLAGPEDIDAWAKERGIEDGMQGLQGFVDEHRLEMAEVFETALVGKPGDRRSIMAALKAGGGDLKKALAAWNEEQRSSLNDICGVCFQYAERFREAAARSGD